MGSGGGERRSEAFVKIQKKRIGGRVPGEGGRRRVGWVRVGVNGEVKFL